MNIENQSRKLRKLPPRKLQRYDYGGLTIEEEPGGIFAVRYYQTDPEIMHDFKPWCDSLEEAIEVAEKIHGRVEAERGGFDRPILSLTPKAKKKRPGS